MRALLSASHLYKDICMKLKKHDALVLVDLTKKKYLTQSNVKEKGFVLGYSVRDYSSPWQWTCDARILMKVITLHQLLVLNSLFFFCLVHDASPRDSNTSYSRGESSFLSPRKHLYGKIQMCVSMVSPNLVKLTRWAIMHGFVEIWAQTLAILTVEM